MIPAIYDNGIHYVTNQKLTLEMLEEISDSEDVLEVTGEYTGGIGGWGASHEHLNHKHIHDYYLLQERQLEGKLMIFKRRWHSIIRSIKPYQYLDEMLTGPLKSGGTYTNSMIFVSMRIKSKLK